MTASMRNQFAYLGIPTPVRTALVRPVLKGLDPASMEASVRELWQQSEREYRYCALDLAARAHKLWRPEHLDLWRHLIVTDSWWDTVDYLATQGIWTLSMRFSDIGSHLPMEGISGRISLRPCLSPMTTWTRLPCASQ